MTSSSNESAERTMERCAECKEEVKGNDKAVDCDICGKWIHIKCRKLSNVLYGELKKATTVTSTCPGIKFLCQSCDRIFEKFRNNMKQIVEKQLEMERKQETLLMNLADTKKEVASVKDSLNKLIQDRDNEASKKEDKVEEDIEDLKTQLGEIKMKYSDVTRVNGAEGVSIISTNQVTPLRTIQLEVSEVMEREKRKNNLVVFGVEETNDENMTKSKIDDIMQAIGIDITKVKYMGRVGRTITSGKSRLVRVICEDAEVRRKVLKGANNLKTVHGFERTYISPDLTKSQQESDKQLRDKLKEIRLQYKEAKINNGEIIIIDNGNRKILHPKQQN